MPAIEHVSAEDAKLEMMLAGDDGEELKEMLDLVESLEADKTARLTFEEHEDVDQTVKILTKAAKIRVVKIKREQYQDRQGRKVMLVHLVERGQQRPRRARPSPPAS